MKVDERATRFFESLLTSIRGSRYPYKVEDIRYWLGEELAKAGVDKQDALNMAGDYLMGILRAEASAIYTRSIP